jgi:hypothetical protein
MQKKKNPKRKLNICIRFFAAKLFKTSKEKSSKKILLSYLCHNQANQEKEFITVDKTKIKKRKLKDTYT